MPYELPEAADDIRNKLAPFLVGFLRIRDRDKALDYVTSLGSCTLVRLGESVAGILTAAHVLDALPNDTPIGLMEFARPGAFGQFKIECHSSDKTYAEGWGGEGVPDLGFLRLHQSVMGTLEARGCVFYNLARQRSMRLQRPEIASAYFVLGVVAESESRLIDPETGHPLTSFQALIGECEPRAHFPFDDTDLAAVEVIFKAPLAPPESYGGVSGGGLWVIAESQDPERPGLERLFLGTAFQERPDSSGRLLLVCHLLPAIRAHLLPSVERSTGAGARRSEEQ